MYKNIKSFILFVILFLFSFNKVIAQILINEISPSTNSEWVEIYNDGNTEVDLTGYLLEDGNLSKTDDIIISGMISANGFLVFSHTEGWLNNGGDTLRLYNNASPSAVIDQYTYGNVDSTKSVARVPNGSENWQITSNVTQGSSNPTLTSSPVPTQNPTSAPTNSPTSSPTKTPTPIPTKTSSPTPKPSITPTSSATPYSSTSPLAVESENSTNAPQVLGESVTKKKVDIIPIGLIGAGVLMVGFAVYNLISAKKNTEIN